MLRHTLSDKLKKSAANYVRKYVPTNKKVFLVLQGDRGFLFNWMRYEFTPIVTNGGYWSFGNGDGWDFDWTAEEIKTFLYKAKYDYLYLFEADDYFNENFASLFEEGTIKSRTLYKFTYESKNVLQPVE